MKECKRCHRQLPETEFYKNISAKDGLQFWCKQCLNDYDNNVRPYKNGGQNRGGRTYRPCGVHPSPAYRRVAQAGLYGRIEVRTNY